VLATGGRTVLVSIGLAVVAAACGGSDGDDRDATARPPQVVMELVAFEPEQLAVPAGTTVRWRNRDVGAHTVTSGAVEQGGAGVTEQPDGAFDSGELSKGDSFEQTFDAAGTYQYFCSIHPATMRGEIRVT
jgi:plastocyanin